MQCSWDVYEMLECQSTETFLVVKDATNLKLYSLNNCHRWNYDHLIDEAEIIKVL